MIHFIQSLSQDDAISLKGLLLSRTYMTSVDLRNEIEEVVPFLFGNDEHSLKILHSYSDI